MQQSSSHPRRQSTRRWNRTAVIALLLLIGGAVVNVAVAWGCSLMSEFTGSWHHHRPDLQVGKRRDVPAIAATLHGKANAEAQGGLASFGYDQFSLWDSDRTTWVVTTGWPARALWMSTQSRDPGTPSAQHEQSGLFLGMSELLGSWIPVNPHWPGFIINTLFYALLLWLLFFAPGRARRLLRRKRGLCEKCAYPIGVSPVCTECGTAVRPS